MKAKRNWDWILIGTLVWIIGVVGYILYLYRGLIF